MSVNIFASTDRQKVLNECGIKWKIDQDLNFVFDSKDDEKRAVKVLRNALEL